MSLPPFPAETPESGPGDEPTSLARPTPVLVGCIMAWVGGAVGLLLGVFMLSVSADSATLDTLSDADRADVVSAFHQIGALNVVWCPVVIVMAFFAFKGTRWAVLTLVAMATIYVLWSIFSLASGSVAQGGLGLVWTAASAALIYGLRPSRAWFDAMSVSRQ